MPKLYLIGVDGGNTKTDYLLYDTEGNFIDGIRSGTCSHEAPNMGFEGSYIIMKENLENLLRRNNLEVSDVAGSCFGLAGVDVPFQKKALEDVVTRIGFKNFQVVNDGFLGIKAASPTGTGACSINGTGTVNVGIDEDGKWMQVGGIGYVSGDEAGGSFLARRTIQAVYDMSYRFGAPTLLQEDVFAMYGITSKTELGNALLQHKMDSTYLIKALCKRANEQDKVAIDILETAGKNMARSTSGVIAELNIHEPINVILAGSVWAKATCHAMLNRFKMVVQDLTKKSCNFIVLEEPPVMGAILWAYELANNKLPSKEVKQKVLKSIDEYQKRYI